jgi:hypothetical protein
MAARRSEGTPRSAQSECPHFQGNPAGVLHPELGVWMDEVAVVADQVRTHLDVEFLNLTRSLLPYQDRGDDAIDLSEYLPGA